MKKISSVMLGLVALAGSSLISIVFFAAIIIIGLAILYGMSWVSLRIYPIVLNFSEICLLINIAILPFAFLKKARGIIGIATYSNSWIVGFTMWLFSVIVTYDIWGIGGLFTGLIFFGIGVMPIALVSCLFKAEWELVGNIIFMLILAYGMRLLGIFIISKQIKNT